MSNLTQSGFGRWKCTHRERGKILPFGRFAIPNLRTIEGANHGLGVIFKGASQATTWYLGLIAEATDVEVSQDDTMSSHAGWTEFQSYDEAARVTWVEGTQAGGILAGAAATFTFSASGAIRGLFLTSNNTKGGTTGTLWSAGLEAMRRLVIDNQTLDVEYETSLISVQ